MDQASLSLRLRVAPELVREGVVASVIYRRWGGTAVDHEVAATPVTGEALTLVVPLPDPSVHTSLPPALGGPWPFALGYIVAREAHGQVLACAPSTRVVWTPGPFPAELFAVLATDARVSQEEREAAIEGLRRLPSGLFLARTTRASRSLAGFEPAADEPVALAAEGSLSWPPAVF